jgi:hypothetical protein
MNAGKKTRMMGFYDTPSARESDRKGRKKNQRITCMAMGFFHSLASSTDRNLDATSIAHACYWEQAIRHYDTQK